MKTTQYQINADKRLQKPVKIALIADLHIGLFSGHERQLRQIVHKLNHIQPDLVVVAGDWTYEPENKLAQELAVLKEIHAPVYSVNGNHDEQYPGPRFRNCCIMHCKSIRSWILKVKLSNLMSSVSWA